MFVFLPFRMDPDRRLLTRDGQPIPLTPKEFDTLQVLVTADGKVVEKEDLISRVWPESFVGDGSLARNISVLRKALGEEVIETHRGRGYRITIPITPAAPQTAPVAAPQPTAQTRPEEPQPTVVPISLPRPRRRLLPAFAVGAAALAAVVAFRFLTISSAGAGSASATAPVHSVLIQKEGATEPTDEGFKVRVIGHFGNQVARKAGNQGFDRIRTVSDDQGYYYRTLTGAEKDFALHHDWILTCVCAVERGTAYATIDFGPDRAFPRFDITLLHEDGKYFVALLRQLSPEYMWAQKIEFPGAGDTANLHTFELRYQQAAQAASLWIDGKQVASGYQGQYQFREDRGMYFGSGIYTSANQGVGVFRSVRFESH